MPGESRCSQREIQSYLNRISGPLLDRIDLHVEVPAVKFCEVPAEHTGEPSEDIRERGDALYAERRYSRIFIGYNGAQSYHSARAFRSALRV